MRDDDWFTLQQHHRDRSNLNAVGWVAILIIFGIGFVAWLHSPPSIEVNALRTPIETER
jgi:hypothetical protein